MLEFSVIFFSFEIRIVCMTYVDEKYTKIMLWRL